MKKLLTILIAVTAMLLAHGSIAQAYNKVFVHTAYAVDPLYDLSTALVLCIVLVNVSNSVKAIRAVVFVGPRLHCR